MKLLIHCQTSKAQPLKFGNIYVTPSHALLGIWLLILAMTKVKHSSKRVLPLLGWLSWISSNELQKLYYTRGYKHSDHGNARQGDISYFTHAIRICHGHWGRLSWKLVISLLTATKLQQITIICEPRGPYTWYVISVSIHGSGSVSSASQAIKPCWFIHLWTL